LIGKTEEPINRRTEEGADRSEEQKNRSTEQLKKGGIAEPAITEEGRKTKIAADACN